VVEWTTGAAILAQAGAAPGSPDDIAWADACAAAVNAGMDARLEGAVYVTPPPLPPELTRAALTAGVVAFKARESNQSSPTPTRAVDDYLETIAPILERYATRGIA
jgi:hypothetical protein